MRKFKARLRFTALFLTSAAILLADTGTVMAAGIDTEAAGSTEITTTAAGSLTSGCYINDIYKDIYTPEDIEALTEPEVPALTMTGRDDVPYFDNYEDARDYVKDQMVARSTEFSLTLPDSMQFMDWEGASWTINYVLLNDSFTESLARSPKEGDYLRSNYVSTKWTNSMSHDHEKDTVTCIFRNTYTSTAEQEAQVDAMIPQVLEELELDGMTDYEKIKAIHDYIANRITYTYTGELECHSTYAALVKGEAVCQGYASLFYRLCKEAGLGCRYVYGSALEAHAWNIVELEGRWYNLDCTWDDANDERLSYGFFLKNEPDFVLHERYPFDTEEVMAQYPMAEISYESQTVKELEKDNLSAVFNTTDGNSISATATDTPKVLYFYDESIGRCVKQLKDLCAADSDTDFECVAIDATRNGREQVQAFKDTHSCTDVTFCYDESETVTDVIKEYCSMAEMDYEGFFPYTVLVDGKNKVRLVISGYYTPEELEQAVTAISYQEPQEPTEPQQPTPVIPVTPQEPAEPQQPAPSVHPITPIKPKPVPSTHPFTDVPAYGWKADAAGYVYHNGIMNGISGTTLFAPDGTLTRGMFATILYRMAGSPDVAYEAKFSDVPPGKWYSDAIIWAAKMGIVDGFGDGTYGVDISINREQVMKMIGVFAFYCGMDTQSDNTLSDFEDLYMVSAWAKSHVGWAVDNGIISGKPTADGGYRIDPKGTATRAECAKMVSKYLETAYGQ